VVVLGDTSIDAFVPSGILQANQNICAVLASTERATIEALDQPGTKLFIHCAAGVHRAPMMALALLGALGWKLTDAIRLIESRRPQADFADVYVRSVQRFLQEYAGTRK